MGFGSLLRSACIFILLVFFIKKRKRERQKEKKFVLGGPRGAGAAELRRVGTRKLIFKNGIATFFFYD